MRSGWALAACLLWAGAGCASLTGRSDEEPTGDGKLTGVQVQGMLESFADQSIERVAETAIRGRASAPNEVLARRNESMRMHFASGVMAAALESDPVNGLLDMMVAITLERWIIDSPRGVFLFGEKGARLFRDTFAPLERNVWAMGAEVLSPEHLDEVRGMIEDWKRENPKALTARFVRFEEFARDRPNSSLAKGGVGLLAPMKETNRQIEDTRRLGERALFLAHRLPAMARWQGTDFVQEALATPPVNRILEQYDPRRVMGESDRLVRGWIDYGARKLIQVAGALFGMLLLYRLILMAIPKGGAASIHAPARRRRGPAQPYRLRLDRD